MLSTNALKTILHVLRLVVERLNNNRKSFSSEQSSRTPVQYCTQPEQVKPEAKPSTLLSDGSKPNALTGFDLSRLSDPEPNEAEKIVSIADARNVDPRFLAAIRLAENGRPGREFGVLVVSAPDWQSQAKIAANTIVHRMKTYWDTTKNNPVDATGRLTQDFIAYFAYGDGGKSYTGWAPINAENDPDGLNKHWLPNVTQYYQRIELLRVAPRDAV